MAFSSCFLNSPLLKIDHYGKTIQPCGAIGMGQKFSLPIRSASVELPNQHILRSKLNITGDRSFLGGSRIVEPKVMSLVQYRKPSPSYASWLSEAQLASSSFTVGTSAVLPFYTLMVLAPNSELTKKTMESSVPYVILGVLYAYLLYLSWTPETVGLVFASKYLLPELSSIAKMFSSEMTLASAWIHLLVIDLFAARQVYQDGLKNQIETRHSVSFCLLFCPIGIVSHVITKALTKTTIENNDGL